MEKTHHSIPEDMAPEVIAAIRSNRKIEAIKLYRELSGCGLKSAKEAVEAWQLANVDSMPRHAGRQDAGLGRVLLVIAAGMALYVVWRVWG